MTRVLDRCYRFCYIPVLHCLGRFKDWCETKGVKTNKQICPEYKYKPMTIPAYLKGRKSSLVYRKTLQGCWGTTDDFPAIPFHIAPFSAALVGLTKSIPVQSLIVSSISFSGYPFFISALCPVELTLLARRP